MDFELGVCNANQLNPGSNPGPKLAQHRYNYHYAAYDPKRAMVYVSLSLKHNVSINPGFIACANLATSTCYKSGYHLVMYATRITVLLKS